MWEENSVEVVQAVAVTLSNGSAAVVATLSLSRPAQVVVAFYPAGRATDTVGAP